MQMVSASQWLTCLAQAVANKNAPEVVKYLDPKIRVKSKEKVDYEQQPQDFMQAKRVLGQSGVCEDKNDWDYFVLWAANFLKHSRYLDQ